MSSINDRIRAEYYKKVFEAIDGLWFMKVEGESGFEKALEIDKQVWEVAPKIQARKLRELLGIKENGPEALKKALEAKFELEGFESEIRLGGNAVLEAVVKKCPWHALMLKSNRVHLAGRIGEVICGTEYPVWMKEFGVTGEFRLDTLLCRGDGCCAMRFSVIEK